MKHDLQSLMAREGFDALWVAGSVKNNPAMVYLTGGGHITGADLIIKRGEDPVLVCGSMEREEAALTGLEVRTYSQYGYRELLKEHQDDLQEALARLKQRILSDLGAVRGRVALYGNVDISRGWGVYQRLEAMMPELTLIGEGPNSILLEARATKGPGEIDRIKKMGSITTEVVAKTAAYLQSRQVNSQEVLLDPDGSMVTVGKVKSRIRLWLAERGAEAAEGIIFAVGRDAGVPHSAGQDADAVCLGKTIIFDLFPREIGGGYFFDFTRTWCLGYAPELEQRIYDHVYSVYQRLLADVQVDTYAPDLQEKTCQYFEDLGHKTIGQDSGLESGYVHSVGHGLGLAVHERPRFGRGATQADRLIPGTVVTIEPGLYYPEKGLGCRLEDTVWVRPDGEVERAAGYPYQLVLPMENWQG
jgi:Xaa-Pro aminopeptidase